MCVVTLGDCNTIASATELTSENNRKLARVNSEKLGIDLSKITVFCVENQHQMLQLFRRILRESDCDIFSGYNIVGYDLRFIFEKAQCINIEPDWYILGRTNALCKLEVESITTKQQGAREFHICNIPGRVLFGKKYNFNHFDNIFQQIPIRTS